MKNRKPQHDNWKTPESLLSVIRKEFGEFYDPCPLNADFDGLEREWASVNYVNPPYSRFLKEAFIRKAVKEWRKGKIVVMLLPVSTSTKIFHECILPYAEIRFLRGRVRFEGVNSKGEFVSNKTGQHDSMLVIFRGNIA